MSNLPNDPLLNISINYFSKKLRKGEINCEQIVTSYLNKIKSVNDKLNAFIFIDEKKAIKDYKAALGLGGNATLPELYEAAGAKFSFDDETLEYAASLIEEQIRELS